MTAVDVLEKQGNCFKLLSACFYEPEKELFLQENLCGNLAVLLAEVGGNAGADAAGRMGSALAQSSAEALRIDYAGLFVGPFELLAPPYGSVYLEEGRRLMGDSTLAVQKMYREAGLTLDLKEAPDHIAFELEFMHALCLQEAEALQAGNHERACELARRQRDFFRRFLAPWTPGFCRAIRKGTDNVFYTALADCLESFVEAMTTVYELAGICEPKEEDCACQAAL